MGKEINIIKKRDYSLLNDLDGDEDVLERFFGYDGTTYISDAISEIADGEIPTYNQDIWDGASNISEYIEEAIASGIAPVEGREIDLIKIFMSGYYQYNTQLLYNNLDVLIFNYFAKKIDVYLDGLESSELNNLDIDEIESAIANEINDLSDGIFDDIEDKANELIERIKNKEFSVED